MIRVTISAVVVDLAAGPFPEIARRLERQPELWPQVPELIRRGRGGLAEQIARRTYLDIDGVAHPWVEPAYVQGSLPPGAMAREQVLWDAALGGPGGITKPRPTGCTIGVNDDVVRARSAQVDGANGIISTANYFGFVTGNFTERTSPALARPVKGVRRGRPRRASTSRREIKNEADMRRNLGAGTVNYAMWWYLGYEFGVWLTAEQLAAGVSTPPKNLGISKRIYDEIKGRLETYILYGPAAKKGQAAAV